MKNYVYKNRASEESMQQFYDKVLKELNVKYEEMYLETKFGNTHVLIIGDKNKAPIFTVHGGNGMNPLNIKLFLPLLEHYCIYAPDVIGFPGKSEPIRLNPKDDSYGEWLKELLDKLKISSIPFVVSSYSSAFMLDLAKIAPERIEKAVLLVPSGIAHGPIIPILRKQMLPFMTYFIRPNEQRLRKAVEPMLTEEEEIWYEFFNLILTNYKMELRSPREFTKKEMSGFKAPVYIIAAENDIFFPPNKVIPKAKYIFNNIYKTKIITGKHLPDKKTMSMVCEEIVNFIG